MESDRARLGRDGGVSSPQLLRILVSAAAAPQLAPQIGAVLAGRAHLLVTEGFASVEEVAFVPTEDLAGIEGFDTDVAGELKARAQAWIEAESERSTVKRKELGVSDDVAAIDKLTPPMLVALGEKGVKTLDDLADLAADELVDAKDGILKEFDLTADDANAIIMAARAHWFEDEKK